MKLADNLKRIRKDNNLSQEQLAEKLSVSRQAVSKWESGQSYPEMDKVLMICKLFNYNIDELMNENIKEVEETKQSKININKYIDDFFAYITKTVDMLSNMKFRQKIKCFAEQIMVGLFLFFVFVIIGQIGLSILSGIIRGLPSKGYYIVRDILKSIYTILALTAGVAIFLHIFKIRYLDYFEIVKEDETKEDTIKENEHNDERVVEKENKKIFIRKDKEKIIIRDPEHSQSKFLNGIIRLVLLFIKFIAVCIAIGFVFSFISIITLLVLSFLFVKTGLIFLGSLLGIISALVINFIILEIFYNFIISKKCQKNRMALMFFISIILAGISIGTILIGITSFNYIDDPEQTNILESKATFQMTDNLLIFNNYYNCNYDTVKYVETKTDEVQIVVKYSKYYEIIDIDNTDEVICMNIRHKHTEVMENIRDFIRDINDKKIVNYSQSPIMYVYASKDNIEKMKQNIKNKKEAEKSTYEVNLQQKLNNLNNLVEIKESKIEEMQEEITEKNEEINSLKQQLINAEDN